MLKKITIICALVLISIEGFSQYDGFHFLMGWSYNSNRLPNSYWDMHEGDSIGNVYKDNFYFHHYVWNFFGKNEEMYLEFNAAPLIDVVMHVVKGNELWQKNGRLKKARKNIDGVGNGVDWALLDMDICFGGEKFYTGLHFALRETGIRSIDREQDEKFNNVAHGRFGLSNFYFHDEFRFGLKLDFLSGVNMAGIGYNPSITYVLKDVFFFSGYYRLTKLYRKDGIYSDEKEGIVLTPKQKEIEYMKAGTFGISVGIFL